MSAVVGKQYHHVAVGVEKEGSEGGGVKQIGRPLYA